MSVLGTSDLGRVWVSTYRGRPPDRKALEKVKRVNMSQTDSNPLEWTDTQLQIGDQSVPGRVTFVPASDHYITDRWALLLFGTNYSAAMTLEGHTPDQLVLAMQDDDAGYTDLKTAVRHHPI